MSVTSSPVVADAVQTMNEDKVGAVVIDDQTLVRIFRSTRREGRKGSWWNSGSSQGEKMQELLFVIAATILSLGAFAKEGGLLDQNAGIVTKQSKYSVSETMDRVEAAAKDVGANIFARIDYQQFA